MTMVPPDTRLRVIIESPFAAPTPERRSKHVQYVRAAMRDSLLKGEAPFASHALYTLDGVFNDDDPAERAAGIAAGLAWGTVADMTALYLDCGLSGGMRMGIKHACEWARPICLRMFAGHDYAHEIRAVAPEHVMSFITTGRLSARSAIELIAVGNPCSAMVLPRIMAALTQPPSH